MTSPRCRLFSGVLLAACASTAGCYTGSARGISPERVAADPDWEVVRGVSFVPQHRDDDCGAAALAMMLSYHRLPTTQAEILAEAPSREGGMTAGELRDIARRRGFVSFVIVGDWSDLEGQIQDHRPVLVGLVKPHWGGRARARFEVVVGINRARRRVLTVDPARGLREDSIEGFAREWTPAGRLIVVMMPRPSPALAIRQ